MRSKKERLLGLDLNSWQPSGLPGSPGPSGRPQRPSVQSVLSGATRAIKAIRATSAIRTIRATRAINLELWHMLDVRTLYFYSTIFGGRVYKWKFCLSVHLSVITSYLTDISVSVAEIKKIKKKQGAFFFNFASGRTLPTQSTGPQPI